jgi:RNA polymerase sigma-70 factor (ECF subfamily)
MDHADEQALLECAKSSPAGFARLFDTYFDRIYAYAFRRAGSPSAAEDIASAVFEDAFRGIKRVTWQGKPIGAWLYRIASRRVVDYQRRSQDQVGSRDGDLGGAEDPQGVVERNERISAVRAGIDRLAPRDREIIRLAFFDELEPIEIAAVLNCTINNTYVRLHRALKHLRTVLESEGRDE